MMENPQPPVLLADPQAGLVGLQDRTIEEFRADRRGRLGKGILCRVEDVDERALADVETEEIGQESSQALEGDALGVGVDGPRRHRLCQNEVVADLKQRGPSVEQISRIGMDTSKHFFQLHGVNAAEKVVLRKKLRRKEMVAFFKALAPTVIGIEACGASHHWARILRSFGHEVKLIAPQLVKPYVKRGKNDTADAEALCEAMSRPTMRFVPVKTAEQQAALMMVALRDRLIRNRTQLSNAIRG